MKQTTTLIWKCLTCSHAGKINKHRLEIGLASPFKDVLGVSSEVLPWSSVTVPAPPHSAPGSRRTVAANQQPGLGEAWVWLHESCVRGSVCLRVRSGVAGGPLPLLLSVD